MASRLKVLTWHIHSSYLIYLTQTDCDFYLPFQEGKPGYDGKGNGIWGDNVFEVPADQVKNLDLDCIIFQSPQNYLADQYEILSEAQRNLPHIYIEHDPPQQDPTNTRHLFSDPGGLLVHVTEFNSLMWDSGCTPTKVIRHGVFLPEPSVPYSGELKRGITVVNNIMSRGRRVGLDIFLQARREIPLDIIGINAEQVGGLSSIHVFDLAAKEPHYRFFFYPIRYTSLGLAVCEAMLMGLPIVALATTEMATTIENGVTGYISNNVNWLIDKMKLLLSEPALAKQLGENARIYAQQHFGIDRFADEWKQTLECQVSRVH